MKSKIIRAILILMAALIPIAAVFFSRHFHFSTEEDFSLIMSCLMLMVFLAMGGLKLIDENIFK